MNLRESVGVVVVSGSAIPGHVTSLAVQIADIARSFVEVSEAVLIRLDQNLLPPAGTASTELTTRVVDQISKADCAVVCSPVYRAGMPGTLKNMFDWLPLEALEGKPIGLVTVGATYHHYLGVDSDMRRIAEWFGSLMMPAGLYFLPMEVDDLASALPAIADVTSFVQSIVSLTRSSSSMLLPRTAPSSNSRKAQLDAR